MQATRAYIASDPWVLNERACALELFLQERDELVFPAIHQAQWLNEHLAEIFRSVKFNPLQHFKTPGRLRGGKTPKTIFKSARKSLRNTVKRGLDLVDPRPGNPTWIAQIEKPIEVIETRENEDVEMHAEPEVPVEEEHSTPQQDKLQEELHDEEPQPVEMSPERSPVRLYTDSDIGSPSVSDTPEKPLRKGSFTFASLPAPEPLKRSIGPQVSENRLTRAESLGLDSDASDEESIDLRAPELIAHDERLKAYESPVPPPAPSSPPSTPTFEPQLPAEITSMEMPGMYPDIPTIPGEDETTTPPAPRRTRSSGKRKAEELEDNGAAATAVADNDIEEASSHAQDSAHYTIQSTIPTTTSKSARTTASDRSRLRAPKPLGRPVRPTAAAAGKAKQQPQPVAIKIKPLSQPKPMNTAPVAAHNQDMIRNGSQQPVLKNKGSAQSITAGNSTFNISTSKAPKVPTKVFSVAQKKKELDEKAAAKDAAVKQQQKERRDNKLEELKRKKLEDDAKKEDKARQNSAERTKKHLVDLDDRDVKRQKSEERQEREQAAADAKKAAFREMQAKRQVRPVASSATNRPQNPPPRPPARLDLHEDMRAEEETPPRLAGPLRQPSLQRQHTDSDLPAYPSNLSKPPVRVSNLNKKASIFTSTQSAAASIYSGVQVGPSNAYTNSQAGPSNTHNNNQMGSSNPFTNNQVGTSNFHNFPQPPPPRPQQQILSMQHFATQKIPFAKTPVQGQVQHPSVRMLQAQAQAQDPGNNTTFAPTFQSINDSPMSLPEIHTDSSDDTDRDASLPSWATPNHIFNMLSRQETINPDHIFPELKAIAMDDVFAENPDRLRRLRMRTSSANWVRTGDALNQVEVLEDRIGRQAIRNAGGWMYGIGH